MEKSLESIFERTLKLAEEGYPEDLLEENLLERLQFSDYDINNQISSEFAEEILKTAYQNALGRHWHIANLKAEQGEVESILNLHLKKIQEYSKELNTQVSEHKIKILKVKAYLNGLKRFDTLGNIRAFIDNNPNEAKRYYSIASSYIESLSELGVKVYTN